MLIVVFSKCIEIKKRWQQAPIHCHFLELMNKASKDDDKQGAPCCFLQVLKEKKTNDNEPSTHRHRLQLMEKTQEDDNKSGAHCHLLQLMKKGENIIIVVYT